VIGIVGIILLIGIVKKNGIILVDFAISAERDHHMPAVEAIRQACLLRFRPIMLTTAAAMLAGVPLALGHGIGSEVRQHHAGCLSLPRSLADLAAGQQPRPGRERAGPRGRGGVNSTERLADA
jgi:hypothetical protein